ncbi:hypothetical protein A1O1_06995 [Capronia coronata CBS 617.96]|uniref:Uncharacterized protein n=1 Tax=Capronia coronata CBS 617.96 TaxID=1182541 RepID=W9XT46_9EURO|nr:uncharacterized protein A1O1_06995 [Capronia coronata CBS 617.96]EXJ83373.1 hypothetical protein A1O1_06995 [Capronia coronata CBS 617.96]
MLPATASDFPSNEPALTTRLVETSTVTAYRCTERFDVTAGTGQFHGSFVEPFLEENGHVVPYWGLASTYNFVKNSVFSIPSHPISCPRRVAQCDSYLFPGGTYLMYPQPTPTSPLSTDAAIIIDHAPGTQVDFARGLDPLDGFLAQDCVVYGSDSSIVGVQFCLAESQVSPGSVLAGVFACSAGTQGGVCRISGHGHVPNVSATMTVYSRRASSVCAASNNSILSVYDLGDPEPEFAVNISALHLAAGWLLNYTASGLPAVSSLNFWFWFAQSDTYSAIWEANAYTTLQSMLSFILWEFCTNNNENPAVKPELSGGQPNLPASFQTTASVCQPFTRLVLLRATFVTYLVLEAAALVFCWAVLVWRAFSQRHALEISSYPLVDFTSKLREKSTVDGSSTASMSQFITPNSGDKAVRHLLGDVKMVVLRQHSEIDLTTSDPDHVSSSLSDRADLASGARSSVSEQPRLVNEDARPQEKSPVGQTEPQVEKQTDVENPASPSASHAQRPSSGSDQDAANVIVALADGQSQSR